MTRLLPLLALLALLVCPVMATNLNFQDGSGNASLAFFDTGVATVTGGWVETTDAKNNYIAVTSTVPGVPTWSGGYTILSNPSSTSYAAATYLGDDAGARLGIALLDGAGTVITETHLADVAPVSRIEVKTSGGTAYFYDDGVLKGTHAGLTANPSYVGFGVYYPVSNGVTTRKYDDLVYGASENMYVLGLPESSSYIVLDDIANDAADGVYNITSSTQVDANNMYGTFSRGNGTSIPPDTLENQSINLVNYASGAIYDTKYTGTDYTRSLTFDIKTKLIDANAPDGWYALTIPGTGAYSNMILKRSNGATVTWDRDTYSTGDTGTVISVIADGGYWDPGAYTYHLGVMDIYGTFHGDNTTISAQTSTVTHEWSEDDNPGVYYAVLFATTADGHQYIFGLDWAELENTLSFTGYVNDAQTGLIISGANLSYTQGATVVNTLSGFDGNYTSGGFATGAPVTTNVTATNYLQYVYSFTPTRAKTINLNVSLVPLTPTYSGLAIGGVARDSEYGRPIQDATAVVTNTTTGGWYTKATSMTGWYLCDEGTSCFLQTKTPYSVWGNKSGYHNSTVYQAVTA